MSEPTGREQAMHDEKAPWPKSMEELTAYIQKQLDGEHDYGSCVYAISLAATATFHYVAGELGCTGFQAGCADMDILRRTRLINGPFLILKGEDALYPQYDLRERLDKCLNEWRSWMADEAKRKLAEKGGIAHPNVLAHWRALAAFQKDGNA